MKTKNVIKALGIVGLAAGVMLAAGDASAQVDNFTPQGAIDAVVNLPDTALGKIVIVVGSIAGLAAYIFTQKIWTLLIVAVILGSPFIMEGIQSLAGGAETYLESSGSSSSGGGGSVHLGNN